MCPGLQSPDKSGLALKMMHGLDLAVGTFAMHVMRIRVSIMFWQFVFLGIKCNVSKKIMVRSCMYYVLTVLRIDIHVRVYVKQKSPNFDILQA